MADTQLFFDDFDNAVVDVNTDPSNGTVTEPAGSDLVCSIANGVDGRWDDYDYKGVLAYENLASYLQPNKLVYFETRLTALTFDGVTCMGGLVLSNDAKTQCVWIAFYPNNKQVYVQYVNGGSHNTWANEYPGLLDDDPGRENLFLRMYYNPGTNRDAAPVLGLKAQEVSFWYRKETEQAWRLFHTHDISWISAPTRFGVFTRNWSPYPQASSYFDYLRLMEVDDSGDVVKLFDAGDPWERSVTDQPSEGAYEDQYELPTAGGPAKHTAPDVGVGQRIPGPPHQPVGSIGPFDTGAYEDQHELPTAGGPEKHTAPEVGMGLHLPGPVETAPPGDRRGPEELTGFEDFLYYALSTAPEFRSGAYDVNGRPFFISGGYEAVESFQLYDTSGEPWANPTVNGFTGYAKDGTHYTAGVQDVGPVYAPWYSEAVSDDRGPRSDFPDRVLVVRKRDEIVLFDLDSYDGTPANLTMWMRFRHGNFFFVGNSQQAVLAEMHNGVLVVAQDTVSTQGGLVLIDFKRDGEQDFIQLIRSNNHYRALSSINMTNRNATSWTTTAGVAGARINAENVYRFVVRVRNTTDMDLLAMGEDRGDPKLIRLVNNVPQSWFDVSGDAQGEDNLNDYWYRNAVFDDVGWLWTSAGRRLFRHLDPDAWYDGPMIEQSVRYNPLQRSVELPNQIRWLVAARDYIYAATDVGVYQVNRGTLEYWLAYTVEGLGGGGRTNTPPFGELIVGGNRQIRQMYVLTYAEASYLGIATEIGGIGVQDPRAQGANGGVTIIRLYDDYVVHSYEYPDLVEDGAFGVIMVPT